MVTVVRAVLLPVWDVRAVFPQMLDGVTGRDHGTTIAVSVPCIGGQRSGRWEATWVRFGTQARDVTGGCRGGGDFFDCLNLDFLP